MADYDLNLVRTFLLLYETRSVTRTAERLSLTQPSVSHALGRMRKQFNDSLFSRSTGGLQPTELATAMYPTLRQAIEVIDSTVSGVGQFDPATSHRTFRLHATDLGEVNLLPPVLARIAEAAPGVDLHITPLNFSVVETELRQGQTDAVICTPRIAADDFERDVLFEDHYCGICSDAHPRIGPTPTLEEFLGERHIAVDVSAGHTDVDRSLSLLGHTRDVALRISHFAALPPLLETTPYLSIIPASVSEQFCRMAGVKTFELPFPVPAVEISLYTYKRVLPDPGTEWFRSIMKTALTRAGGDPGR
ncbi:LysR family transcriptional regulator [Rhodococcus sp. T2V]|uniref:LysR family transcriptional regulator n=1 Tax=Rhodococcus sp. T2V TaxID=3034164 RepID=UPI0023E0D1CB|nr:LysR family transcriptional regulator [Rhodococcus sp. T2V]MDF3306616.1 LysR family transcriptional regulator [Rhodococcus sp. T2V]